MSYADAGGVRIVYDGEGPRADDAVVFLGGWCISGRSFFALLAERLAARHRVIRLDWRGHGDSGRPGADFGHDELADDALAVIGASGVGREFSAANPWFSVKRLDGVTHFPALEIPDATAAEIENFLG